MFTRLYDQPLGNVASKTLFNIHFNLSQLSASLGIGQSLVGKANGDQFTQGECLAQLKGIEHNTV